MIQVLPSASERSSTHGKEKEEKKRTGWWLMDMCSKFGASCSP